MKVKTYIKESYDELVHKVSWPTWADLQNSAIVVLVACVLIAIVVLVMDFSFKNVMQVIYNLVF